MTIPTPDLFRVDQTEVDKAHSHLLDLLCGLLIQQDDDQFAGHVRAIAISCTDVDLMLDICAYIRISRAAEVKPDIILFNVIHDLAHDAGQDTCYLPRTHGYAAREEAEAIQQHQKGIRK